MSISLLPVTFAGPGQSQYWLAVFAEFDEDNQSNVFAGYCNDFSWSQK